MSYKEWKEFELRDLIVHKKGFAFKSKDLTQNGHPVIKVTNFTDNSINVDECFFVNKDEGEKYIDYQIFTDDIIIATVGSWANNPNSIVGKVIKVPKIADGAFLNQNSVKLRAKKDFNQLFIYYALKCKDFSDHLIAGARGSANQASVALEDIFKYRLNLPSLETQEKIASILSSLDDKIELNKQTNQTLEAIAQTLFKEMCLPKSEELPEGWRVGKLGEVMETVSKTHKIKQEKIIFLNTSDILEGNILHNNYSDVSSLPGQAKKSIQQNDILLSEIRPANKRFAFVDFDGKDFVVSTKLMVLRSKGELSPYLFYCYLTSNETLNYLQHLAETRSGTFPQITFTQLEDLEITVPPQQILENLTHSIESIYKQILQNNKQNQTLISIRDSLLPKLMKGEIEV